MNAFAYGNAPINENIGQITVQKIQLKIEILIQSKKTSKKCCNYHKE